MTIKIKQGVKFHNGREIVAQDVVDNIARAKDKSLGHYLFGAFDPSVEDAVATDKYTVKITYKKIYRSNAKTSFRFSLSPKRRWPMSSITPLAVAHSISAVIHPATNWSELRLETTGKKENPIWTRSVF